MAFTPSWVPQPKSEPRPENPTLALLRELSAKLDRQPEVKVPSPPPVDLSPILHAIRNLPAPRVTTEPLNTAELVAALKDALTVEVPSPDLSGLDALLKRTIEEMPRGGGGGSRAAVKVKDTNGRSVNPASEDTLSAIRAGLPADYTKKLDYDGRADSNPVYVGMALTGIDDDGEWTIQKLTYDGASRLTQVQVSSGAWSDRASLFS